MKLYTEEQMSVAINAAKANPEQAYLIQAMLTPIELPSDEEILVPFPTEKDENFRDGKEIKMWMNGWEEGYKEALQSLRNKIQGGNK